jgi:hypothetical protein
VPIHRLHSVFVQHPDIDVTAQLFESSLDLIDSGSVIQPK